MKQKGRRDNYIWIGLMIATPLVVTAVCMIVIRMIKGTNPVPGIQWNDEANYIKLIQTCVRCGHPKGYWGFDGNHAILGTGGAWSPAILWPYAIFALIFPVGQSFVFWVNLFYITLANTLFIFLAGPDKRNLMRGVFFQATSAILILYLNVNMSEIFRFSIAIVLAGMFYRLFFLKTANWLKYIVIPVFILFAVQVYVFFAFCIPIYVFGILKEKKLWVRFIAGIGAMGLITGLSYGLLRLISSNYNIAKTERLFAAIKAGQILSAAKIYLHLLKDGLTGVFNLWQYVYAYPLYPFYVLLCIAVVGIALAMIIRVLVKDGLGKKKNTEPHKSEKTEQKSEEQKDFIIGIMITYSVSLFFLMYLSLYTIVPDTFMRGTFIVVIFSFYLLFMGRNRWLVRGILFFQAVGLFVMAPNWRDFTAERYETRAIKEEWNLLAEDFKDLFIIKEQAEPWENTVLFYTMEPRVVNAVPAGLGFNFVLTEGVFQPEAEFLVFSDRTKEQRRADWLEQDYDFYLEEYGDEIEKNYKIIYEKNNVVLYEKKEITD